MFVGEAGGGASKKTCSIQNHVLFRISSPKWRHAFVWLISQREVVRVDGVLSNADEKQKQKSDFDLCFADGSQP